MSAFFALYRKEWMESLRTYRALILFVVCILFGSGSPFLAKMLPNILAGYKLNGLVIKIPTPTVFDAFAQFFKNFSQMGLIVLLLIFAGILAQELTLGTLIIPLSKGLPRTVVILAKYLHALTLWSLCYLTAAAAQCIYTQYLFHKLPHHQLFLSLFCLWLFGDLLLALLLLFSTWISSIFGGLALTAGCVAALFIGQTLGRWTEWNPLALASEPAKLLSGQMSVEQMNGNLWCTLIVITGALILSIRLFATKELTGP